MNIEKEKKLQRILSSSKRKKINENNLELSSALLNNLIKIKEINNANFIASFISIKTEINTKFINDYLFSLGKKICLPVIINNNQDLIFRLYDKKTNLKKGKFGVLEPNENQKEILPDIILTPCLAFDNFFYRLGYGGGYYDRTFKKFKKLGHPFISVAVAYDDQKIKKVITDKNDQKIDFILTEKHLYS